MEPTPTTQSRRNDLGTPQRGTPFDQWYHEVQPTVRRFVRRCVPADACDDIVAAVFLAGWRRAEMTGHHPPTGWLIATSRNKIADHWRKEYRSLRLSDRLGAMSTTGLDVAVSPDGTLDVLEIQEVLDALPDRYRSLLVLRYVEGWSQREVAELTEQSESSVESALARARRKFRDCYDSVA